MLVGVGGLAALKLRVLRQKHLPRFRAVAVHAERRARVLEDDPLARLVGNDRRHDVRPARAEVGRQLGLEALDVSTRLEPDGAVTRRHTPRRRPRPVLLDYELADDVDVLARESL